MTDDLKQSLVEDAGGDTPTFSGDLHARTLARLAAARRDGTAPRAGVLPPRRRRRAAIAMSLAVAVIAVVLFVRPGSAPPPVKNDQPAQFMALIDSLGDSARPLADAARQPVRVAADQIALLRDDARNAGQFVIDQLPGLPADAKAN